MTPAEQRRRGLGRGLGALIPSSAPAVEEPEETSIDPAAAPEPHLPGRSDAAADPGEPGSETGPESGTGHRPEPAPDGAGSVAWAGGAEDLVTVPGTRYADLPVDALEPNPRQPRQVFEEEALAELTHSVREIGLLQPVVVRPTADPGRFEIVAGERRWRAVRAAGLTTIPAIVRDTPDDDLLRDALLENLHRAQLNPLEEAAAYAQLLEDFGGTQEELARRLGRSRPQVSNTLRLLRLPPRVQRRVAAGVLSAGHARALLGLDDEEAMERLADRTVAEGLSVRAVEEIVLVGDGDGRARRRTPRPRGPRPHDPDVAAAVAELVARVSDRLDTRVRADVPAGGRGNGRLVIEFADLQDLRRIADEID